MSKFIVKVIRYYSRHTGAL